MSKTKYRLLLAAILTGTFLVPVNSTMITIGLTTIAQVFDHSLAEVSWIITIYLIVMAATQPVAGKLGDLFGYKRMFLLGLVLSFIGSIACAFAFNLWSMIVFRSFQALGGSLAVPNGTALLRHAVGREKLSRTFGLFGLLMGLGAAVGPLIGSALIGSWGWKSIFWVNIPFLILSFVIALFVLPNTERKRTPIDALGSLSLASSLSLIVLFITHPEWIRWWSVVLLAFSIVFFIVVELKLKNPLIEFSLFRKPSFRGANYAIFLSNSIMYGTILIIPILFEQTFLISIQRIGLFMFVFSLSMSLCSWLGGRLSTVISHQRLIGLAFLLQGISVSLFLILSAQTPLFLILLTLIIGGLGAGIGLPSMQTKNLESIVKEKSGVASGIYSTFRYMGSMLASALVSILFQSIQIFYIFIGLALLGWLVSFTIKETSSIDEQISA
ncbi:hypothetical protein BEP19_08585 [Ammoniphilus oxalaticus]|uniref:Major facilitator superfamily (MFS) profile domain-containing protein n=1 Tax=Ammoniphilus oxalaticus TaxID=66863 RepID=A0A419SKD8_9BACL|nr:MFS transporter [Ammoniphilus oxalaticus]RKD24435.1 hypothetical protein BEP19_08585 [Ammoniphilus oxalaticus]